MGEQDKEDPRGAERWTRPKLVEAVAREVGAREHVVFGGCVSEESGGFMRKNMAKSTPAELRDRRDWDEIRAWAQRIAAELGGGEPRS